METIYIIKILILTTLSFVLTFLLTPGLTHFLYKYKLGKSIRNTGKTPIFSKLHAHKSGTPTMGGILIWLSTLIIALIFFYLHHFFGQVNLLTQLNFLTRPETLLPLGALIATAMIGLIDDLIDIKSHGQGGIRVRHRLLIYSAIAVIGALWFYFKLDWDIFHVPFLGNFYIGWWYIPLFIFIIIATAFSVNETDGLDGLAGGTLLAAFAAYGTIAFLQGKINLAALCGVIIGALLAFIWFNIQPARFYMGDTGAMSLGVTLGIVAMLTNQALLLIFIGFIFMLESISVIAQLSSKKIFQRRIFKSAPLHHHLEYIGWPESKIVMRFWIIAAVTSVMGIIIFMLDKGL